MTADALKYCLYVREDLASLEHSFFDTPELYGMRSDMYMYRELKHFLRSKNIDLETQRVHSPQESDVIICLNETDRFTDYIRTSRNRLLVLILSEPPVYNKKDWDEKRHAAFDLVFTYDQDLVQKNRDKYIQFCYPIELDMERPKGILSEEGFLRKKHSCMIAGAFAITYNRAYPQSLLYERYKVLTWYNDYAPEQLDYYGRTEPEQKFRYFRGASLVNRINPELTHNIARYLYRHRLSGIYKGSLPGLSKNKALSDYKFNFCFENSSLKGYITEKIFDCFFSGTVPIYYGAPDIGHYIPEDCYLSFTQFESISALQKYLAEMDYDTYLQYLVKAADFLSSPAVEVFSTEKFIEKLYSAIRL